MRIIIITLILLILPVSSQAASSQDSSVNDMHIILQACKSEIFAEKIICASFIDGLLKGTKLTQTELFKKNPICFPKKLKRLRLGEVVGEYYRSKVISELDDIGSAAIIVWKALSEKFPCSINKT